MCLICGWIYDESLGDAEHGIAPGTRWADVPKLDLPGVRSAKGRLRDGSELRTSCR
jgi:hypothetical protein